MSQTQRPAPAIQRKVPRQATNGCAFASAWPVTPAPRPKVLPLPIQPPSPNPKAPLLRANPPSVRPANDRAETDCSQEQTPLLNSPQTGAGEAIPWPEPVRG